jgi:hypothetical protein
MMKTNEIRSFYFAKLTTATFVSVVEIFRQTLTPEIAQQLGIMPVYVEFLKACEQLDAVFGANPKQLQTEEVKQLIKMSQRMMSLFRKEIRVNIPLGHGELHEAALQLNNAANPLTQGISRANYAEVIADMSLLLLRMEEPEMIAYTEALGLTRRVEDIKRLSKDLDQVFTERAAEMEYKRNLPKMILARKRVKNQLKIICYQVLPTIRMLATDPAQRALIDDLSLRINGIFDTFRHLLHRKGHHQAADDNLPTQE